MAVMECNEITDRSGTKDSVQNKRYTRTFRILTDTTTRGSREVLDHAELPDYGDIWESVGPGGIVNDFDEDAFVTEKRVVSNNRDLYHEWIIAVEYVGRGDPTLEPPEVSWASVKFQAAYQKDVNDQFVVNSAGDPYEGGLTRDRTRFTVMIRQNVLTWNPVQAMEYLDTLNETLFLPIRHPPGFDPGLAKLSELNADAVWYADLGDIHYWKRQAKIEINLLGWRDKILDAGFNKLVGGVRVPIVLAAGKPSSPVPLDGAGQPLPAGGDPEYITRDPYETKDWVVDLGLNY